MSTSVLDLHHPSDSRFTLKFITTDQSERRQRSAELSDDHDTEMAIREQSVNGETIYLLYTRTRFEAAYPDFETDEGVLEWLDDKFSDQDKQVLFTVIDIFDGILTAKEEQGSSLATYKRMELEAIPEILNRVQWRQTVPKVGSELLSHFILAHPMPNTNHRTGIGLLDRYLTSYDESFAMPDTGEEDQWYQWISEFIYNSKRLLTLRNHLPLLRWARTYGYAVAERKEGIQIDLKEIDLERSNHHEYYTDQHLSRSHTFVKTVLNEADATHLLEVTDDGKRAFTDRLKG